MRWFRNSRAPRAEGSHVRVAVFPVNNRPETVERFRPHVKVGSSHDAAVRRGALASDAFVALFTFQTAHVYSFPRRVSCARDFVPLLRSPRIEGWAKRRLLAAASAFACVPGLAAIISGLGAPPNAGVWFGGIATSMGVLTILLIMLRSADLSRVPTR